MRGQEPPQFCYFGVHIFDYFFRQVGVVTGAWEVESLMIEDPEIEAGKMEFPRATLHLGAYSWF